MTRAARVLSAALAVVVFLTIAASASRARADLTDDLLPGGTQSNNSGSTAAQQKAADTAATTEAKKVTSDSSATTVTAGGSSGPALMPAVSPVVIDSYSTDPDQLQAGTRFTLSITVKNPGTDGADDVVVRIGPEAQDGWGAKDELVVLGSGSAQYVGALAAGASNSNASFDIMCNPNSTGGVRSIPVSITWKAKDYEHTTTESIGLLVNSYVSLDAQILATTGQYQKKPFKVRFRVKNNTTRTVKALVMRFSGSGATPSNATSVSVGDLPPMSSKVLTVAYTAPLVGRAKLIGTLSYVDDFGDLRSQDTSGWARVQRAAPAPTADTSQNDPSVGQQVAAFVGALFGVSG